MNELQWCRDDCADKQARIEDLTEYYERQKASLNRFRAFVRAADEAMAEMDCATGYCRKLMARAAMQRGTLTPEDMGDG